MASRKVKDLSVVTGEYQVQGETKKRYENVGGVFETEDGNQYLMLKRTFNPAGVPFRDGGDSIIIGMYDLKEKDGAQPQRQAPEPQRQPTQQPALDDETVPF